MTRHPSRSRYASQAGFTLAEIVITLGILALAFLPLLGLTAFASSSIADAGSKSATASIATAVIGKVQQAEPDQIEDWITNGGTDSYYDFEGFEVAAQTDANFTARFEIKSDVSLGGPVTNSYSSRVTVHVCTIPGVAANQALNDVSNPLSTYQHTIRSFRTIVADLGK